MTRRGPAGNAMSGTSKICALALAGALATALLLLLIVAIGSPIAAYKINQARKAEAAQRRRAEVEALKVRQNSYASDMVVAQKAIEEGNLGRARLRHRVRTTRSSRSRARSSPRTLKTIRSIAGIFPRGQRGAVDPGMARPRCSSCLNGIRIAAAMWASAVSCRGTE